MHLVLQLLCLELELEVFSILCRELPTSAGGHAAPESPAASEPDVQTAGGSGHGESLL